MLKNLFKREISNALFSKFARNFVYIPADRLKEQEYLVQPMLDLQAKRFRKIVLDRTILERNKTIVPSVRVRQEDDTLEKLRNNKLCAGVINGRDEFPDVDLVFQSRQMINLRRKLNSDTQSHFIQVGDELIRCTLEEVKTHYIHNWVIQAKFNRYIPGRPNLIYLPIKMVQNKENKYINKGSDVALKYEGLWVYSYNDDYPIALELNPATATPGTGYRLGDFVNTLPDGIELHPRYKPELNYFLVELGLTRDIELEKQLEYLEFQRRMKAGEMLYDEAELEKETAEELGEEEIKAKEISEAKKAARKEKAKKARPKSLKKLVAQMKFTVKEGLVAATETKSKGGKDHKEG